jgi:hypothetical protein
MLLISLEGPGITQLRPRARRDPNPIFVVKTYFSRDVSHGPGSVRGLLN